MCDMPSLCQTHFRSKQNRRKIYRLGHGQNRSPVWRSRPILRILPWPSARRCKHPHRAFVADGTTVVPGARRGTSRKYHVAEDYQCTDKARSLECLHRTHAADRSVHQGRTRFQQDRTCYSPQRIAPARRLNQSRAVTPDDVVSTCLCRRELVAHIF